MIDPAGVAEYVVLHLDQAGLDHIIRNNRTFLISVDVLPEHYAIRRIDTSTANDTIRARIADTKNGHVLVTVRDLGVTHVCIVDTISLFGTN